MGLISKPIFSRLAKRFEIRQANVEAMESGQVLVPVTNVDDLFATIKQSQITGSATARTDLHTVPSNKRWRVISAVIERANAGVNNIGVVIDGTATNYSFGSSATNQSWNPYGLILKAGDSMRLDASTGTSGAITSTVLYLEEDV